MGRVVSRALGLWSAQAATLRNLDFRLTWSVVVKCCHAMIGHSEGGVKVKGCFGPSFRKGWTSHCYEADLSTCFSLRPHRGALDRPDQRGGGSDRRPPLSVWADIGNAVPG